MEIASRHSKQNWTVVHVWGINFDHKCLLGVHLDWVGLSKGSELE